tara:strand:- start:273 stop:560 length:288 start_codon:yes stop_codon:yes gene_type:complete
MNKLYKKEEKEFYTKLGKFIAIKEATFKVQTLAGDLNPDDLKEIISVRMLNNFKKGFSRMHFFKFVKLMEHYNSSMSESIDEFNKYLNCKKGETK